MPEILFRTQIAAPPEAIYAALSTQEGLSAVWTDNCSVEPKEGSTATFRFGPEGDVEYVMEVESLQPGRLVGWRCVSAGLKEWPGTTVMWRIEPSEGEGDGAVVSFAHAGWSRSDGMLPDCAYAWAMIIRCLDRYVVDGVRDPWFQAGIRG